MSGNRTSRPRLAPCYCTAAACTGAILVLLGAGGASSGLAPAGPYFGLTPPSRVPEVLAPGFISTGKNELNAAFSPDGTEFFFSVGTPGVGYRGWHTSQVDGRWTPPAPAEILGRANAVDMAFSPDGRRLYFCSTRPAHPAGEPSEGFRIWYVEQAAGGWTAPKLLQGPVNEGQQQVYPAFARDGAMYFQSARAGSLGKADVYRSRQRDGAFTMPENLGPAINSEHHEGDVAVDADETVLIVSVTGRPDSLGAGDLYVSFREPGGAWHPLVNMGPTFNTPHHEYCPVLTPDSRAFIFTRRVEGQGDLLWVDAAAVWALEGAQPPAGAPRGAYLGYPPPGLSPRLFAPGLVSTGFGDGCTAFGSGQRFFLYQWFSAGLAHTVWLEQHDDRWTEPRPLPFLASHRPGDFTVAPDGRTLWFEAGVAQDGSATESGHGNIWTATWTDGGWSAPVFVGPGINTDHHDSFPSVASDGTLWFFSRRPGGHGRSDLYFAPRQGATWQQPRNAGCVLNTEHDEWDPFIAPNGQRLIFCSTMPGGRGEDDLYVTFRLPDGSWTVPANLGPEINSARSENRPSLSPDGQYLFFTSTRRGNRDVYWVSTQVFDRLAP